MFDLLHDMRSSLRTLGRRPLYPLVAVGILTLGLSVAVSVFAYMNGFDQPFPGADADGLVRVFGTDGDQPYQEISYLDFLDYAEADRSFQGLAATNPYFAASVRLESMTEVAFLEAVSGDYFPVLDVAMRVGRGLTAADDRPAADPVAVISHAWWQRSFGGDRSVIGSVIYLNFRPFTVVGVAAPEFRGSTSDFRPEVWIPIAPFRDRYASWDTRAQNRDVPLVRVFGRLRAGSGEDEAAAELRTIAAGFDEVYPRQRQVTPRDVRVERATWIDPRARVAEASSLRLMTVAALVLLLLVCANVANLLLSVAIGRRREAAVRAALGASPWRLCRNVLIENVALAVLAGVIALAAARTLSARIGSYFARPSVWGENVAREAILDWRVVAFAIAVSIGTGALAGLLPAVRTWSRDLVSTLRSDATRSAGAENRVWGWRAFGVHDLLISTQLTLTVVLLVVAGLVLRTLATAADLDPGFSYDRLVVTHVSTSSTTLEASERDQFFRELARRSSEEAWVRDATVADFAPLSPHPSANLLLPGQSDPVRLVYSMVIPGFFEALDIDVVRGRGFAASDTAGAANVAIVNQSLADQYFAGEDPIGRSVRWPGRAATEPVFEIVGVVSDTKTQDFFAEPEATVYFSYPQHPYPTGSVLIVAANGDATRLVPTLATWLRDFEPHLAIVNVIPYTEVVRGFLYTQRMNAELFSALAFVALSLAVIGIFAVVSLAVRRRTREIGIRIAVGAGRANIRRWVVRRALVPVLVGVGAGLAMSIALTGLVRGLLFGVEPIDPVTYAAGTIVLVVATVAAGYVPARRAAALDPVASLRGD